MALYDYSTRISGADSRQNTVNAQFDIFFGCCYLLEFVLKVIGMGFLLEKNTYLREGWNLIDFAVVVSTYVFK